MTPVRHVTTILLGGVVIGASLHQAARTEVSELGIFDSAAARFCVEVLVDGLQSPWALGFLPDGRALVTDRPTGRILLLDTDTGQLTPLQDLPPVHTREDAGMHDLLVHPGYADNGWIYFAYSAGDSQQSTTAVDRARLDGRRLVERQRLFTARALFEDNFHYGVRLVLHDGYLYVAVGDRHQRESAQRLDSHAGKILRLHDDGRVPRDNPFVGQAEALPEIWSYGHRNPQGLGLDPDSGELWEHEHGPSGGDELNLIRRGGNYGWPVISYGFEYEGGPIGEGLIAKEGMEQPRHVWVPAIAPSDLLFYTGAAFPMWRGSLFLGSLSQTHLDRLVLRDGRVVLEEKLLTDQGGRVRFVRQGPDGSLYLGIDGGRILRVRPAARASLIRT